MRLKRKVKISIGFPVFNGEKTIKRALISLTTQTFKDFEIIISDNASTDKTQEICEGFAVIDPRIRYIRQSRNFGIVNNFKVVLDEAQGEFFTWAACDDIRSKDFLMVNYNFLIKNPNFVASTSPDLFGAEPPNFNHRNVFSLRGNLSERFNAFFENCWKSHGIFYSLNRTDIIKKCDVLEKDSFLGQDWAIILFLLKFGNINRVKNGFILFGPNGMSSKPEYIKNLRYSIIDYILPFHTFFKYVMSLDFKVNSVSLCFIFFRVNFKIHLVSLSQYIRNLKYFVKNNF